MTIKICITGAGPSGIFCALSLYDLLALDFQLDIYDGISPLKTILPTGGGRCNISNNIYDVRELVSNYPRGEKFLYSVFSKFGVSDTISYFEKIGIKTYVQDDNRIFPVSDSSKDVREKMLDELRKHKNVRFIKRFIQNKDELEKYDRVVIATGSKDGWNLARQFLHTIKDPRRALCGYITKEKYPPGVSINTDEGAILFTHQGVSGPFIYKHSSINAYEKFPRIIEVDLIDVSALRERIKLNPKKAFGNIVSEFIPKSLSKVLVKRYDTQSCQIKKEEIEELKTLRIEALDVDNKGEIVSAGGVQLNEVDNFCKSKLNERLYFCGEVLDIDGFCGGFNLQNCWSSAYCAALGISNEFNP